ncbi:hypothetical protein IDJ75_08090 [Mucilaginibacter rigui]|uniref:Uncharacterized protein n=1 Tax=Mucilaginibacter rigui TaxID=534635 RepID=A0ABR7X3S2_9SPHI|nr:hypothetical protein [Mucilaginibacter rigui]MBD1385237.1 hypothetical protein [Mucilaginibacter rigui]
MDIQKEFEGLLALQKAQPGNRPLLMGDKDTDIFQSILNDLKDTVISKVKKKATGWIMNLVGLGPGPEPKDEVKEALEKQYQELKVIESKIDALSAALNTAVEAIKAEIDGAKYYTAVQGINTSAANIDAAFERLKMAAQLEAGTGKKSELDELAAYIRNNIPNAFIAIKNNLLGTASGGENMTSLGTRVAFKASKSVNEYAAMAHTQFMYYYGLQVKALMLIIEAYHYNDSSDMASKYYNSYVGQMNDEVKIYMGYAPKTVLQNTLQLDTDVTDILPKGDRLYVQAGMQTPVPKFITLNPNTAQKINEFAPDDVRINFTMAEKDGFAYTASMAKSDDVRWDIIKIKLGDAPAEVGRLSWGPPGSGFMRAAFLLGFDIDGDYLYALFMAIGVPGFTTKVINLKTFTFESDLTLTDPLQGVGSGSSNGIRIKNNKMYTTAWFSSEAYSTLKIIDVKTKAIIKSINIEPQSGNGIKSPVVIKDNLLYCTSGDTQLRVFDISTDTPTKLLQQHINIYMQNIIVDGNLIYITSDSNMQDTRGDVNVIYVGPNWALSQKAMRVGNGTSALRMDKTRLYAGAGGGETALYIMSYISDPNALLIPVQPILAGSLPE